MNVSLGPLDNVEESYDLKEKNNVARQISYNYVIINGRTCVKIIRINSNKVTEVVSAGLKINFYFGSA
jgi:hypothetical protein